jgi:hypothetical protein
MFTKIKKSETEKKREGGALLDRLSLHPVRSLLYNYIFSSSFFIPAKKNKLPLGKRMNGNVSNVI